MDFGLSFVCSLRSFPIVALRMVTFWVAFAVILLIVVGIKRIVSRTGRPVAKSTKFLNVVLLVLALIYLGAATLDRYRAEKNLRERFTDSTGWRLGDSARYYEGLRNRCRLRIDAHPHRGRFLRCLENSRKPRCLLAWMHHFSER
jgi:hypothetical protein